MVETYILLSYLIQPTLVLEDHATRVGVLYVQVWDRLLFLTKSKRGKRSMQCPEGK